MNGHDQSILFAGVLLLGAVALSLQMTGKRANQRLWVILRSGLIAILVASLMSSAQQAERGEALRIRVQRLQVPLASIQPPTDEGRLDDPASPHSAYLIVGDQLPGSDLVVSPFGKDTERNREVLGDASRPLAVLHARRGANGAQGWLCIHGYAADEALDLPGWHVVADRGSDDPGDDLASVGADKAMPVQTRCDIPLEAGTDAIRVRIFRSEYGVTANNEKVFKADAQIRREVFVSRRGSGEDGALSLRLNPETALVASLGTCGDPVNRILPPAPRDDRLNYLPERNLAFPQLGSGGQHPLLDPAHLGRPIAVDEACTGHAQAFAWPQGPGERAILTGTVERHYLPWVALFLTLSALLFYPFLRATAWQDERAEGATVFFLQALLVLRALFGIAGIPNSADVSRTEVIYDLAIANACLPALVIALLMRAGPDYRRSLVAMALFAFGSFGATVWWLQSLEGVVNWGFVLGLTGVVLFLRSRTPDARPLLMQAHERLKAMPQHFSTWEWGACTIVAAVAVRLTLRAFGYGLFLIGIDDLPFAERFFGFALSIIYQPAMVIGFACLAAGYVTARPRHRVATIVGLFVLALVVTPLLISDTGMVFVFAAPIALVLGWVGMRRFAGRRHLALALPLAMMLAMVAAMWPLGRVEVKNPTAPAGLAAHMTQVSSFPWSDRNYMRILRFVAPEKVAAFGNRAALESLDQAASMEPLGRAFLGHGYMEPSRVREPLVSYQYMDNLAAVHVTWPFGRLGAMALLAFYGVFASIMACRARAVRPAATGPASPSTSAAFTSLMAGTTLAWSAMYMVAANLNLVPFAGKNLYLVSATSGADLLEGTGMILLAALGWLHAENNVEVRA